MKKQLRILGLIVTAAVAAPSAFALDITGLGGLNFYSPAGQTGSSSTGAFSWGVLAGFDFLPGFLEIETGFLRNGNKYTDSLSAERSFNSLEIPVLLRLNPLPLISVGLGPYYEMFNDYTLTAGGVTTPSIAWDNALQNYKTNTIGLKANARFAMPFTPMFKFVLDASYKKGFTNRAPSGTYRDSDLAFLLGLQFSLL